MCSVYDRQDFSLTSAQCIVEIYILNMILFPQETESDLMWTAYCFVRSLYLPKSKQNQNKSIPQSA